MKQLMSRLYSKSNSMVDKSSTVLMCMLFIITALAGYTTVIGKMSFIEFITCGIFLILLTISILLVQILNQLKINSDQNK
jgi:hypothetical protein